MHSERVVAYVDGFNLYYGLKEKGWKRYYWLNIRLLVENLLKPQQTLVFTKYFTARIRVPDRLSPRGPVMEAKRKRQSCFIEALSTLDRLGIYEGHFLAKITTCNKCKASWNSPEEKMTDVRIATELLLDAFDDRFDTAMILSGDSDLVPPIEEVRKRFGQKRIVVAFPPRRASGLLSTAAHASFTIGKVKIKQSQFPQTVTKADGTILSRPNEWQ